MLRYFEDLSNFLHSSNTISLYGQHTFFLKVESMFTILKYSINSLGLVLLVLSFTLNSSLYIIISWCATLTSWFMINRIIYRAKKRFNLKHGIKKILLQFIIENQLYSENNDLLTSVIFSYTIQDNLLNIIAHKRGTNFDKKLENIEVEIQALFSLPLSQKKVTYNEVIYSLEIEPQEEIKQFKFEKVIDEFVLNNPLDVIRISNIHKFSLKSNTNIGLYGRTGTGKTVALQWLLYNAISKGSGIKPNSHIAVVDGKGADLFALGNILKESFGEQISVGQTPHSLAKISREFCKLMNNRFELIKNNIYLNADGYDLNLTPNFLFVDELASIRDSCGSSKEGKVLWNEILQNLGLIARKGRQASCHLVLSTQDPNAENIPVELRNQISAVLYLGSPSIDRLKMAFSMCELENIPIGNNVKGEALFYADGENMIEPQLTITPFVDLKTKDEFRHLIESIRP